MAAGVIVSVLAHPGASRPRVVWNGDSLHVWVTAPAHEGKANQALAAALAGALGVPRSRVELLRGARSRSKVFRVDGVDPGALDRLKGLKLG